MNKNKSKALRNSRFCKLELVFIVEKCSKIKIVYTALIVMDVFKIWYKRLHLFTYKKACCLKMKVRESTLAGYPRKTSHTLLNSHQSIGKQVLPTSNFSNKGHKFRSTLYDQTKSFEAKVRSERSDPPNSSLTSRPMQIETVEKLATPAWRIIS